MSCLRMRGVQYVVRTFPVERELICACEQTTSVAADRAIWGKWGAVSTNCPRCHWRRDGLEQRRTPSMPCLALTDALEHKSAWSRRTMNAQDMLTSLSLRWSVRGKVIRKRSLNRSSSLPPIATFYKCPLLVPSSHHPWPRFRARCCRRSQEHSGAMSNKIVVSCSPKMYSNKFL